MIIGERQSRLTVGLLFIRPPRAAHTKTTFSRYPLPAPASRYRERGAPKSLAGVRTAASCTIEVAIASWSLPSQHIQSCGSASHKFSSPANSKTFPIAPMTCILTAGARWSYAAAKTRLARFVLLPTGSAKWKGSFGKERRPSLSCLSSECRTVSLLGHRFKIAYDIPRLGHQALLAVRGGDA